MFLEAAAKAARDLGRRVAQRHIGQEKQQQQKIVQVVQILDVDLNKKRTPLRTLTPASENVAICFGANALLLHNTHVRAHIPVLL